MPRFSFAPRTLRMFTLLCAFPLVLTEHPATGRQLSQENKTNHAPTYIDQDSYQIYSALLEGEGHSLYVIRIEIDGYPDLARNDLGIEGDIEFMLKWGRVMDDYAKQNRTAKLLQRDFFLPKPYELIPESNIFPAEHGQKGWDDYYQRYPTSGGYYSFSAVGFNPARTRALVDMGHHCGMLCGYGGPHFFEKKNGKWHEVRTKATVMMWAS